MARFMRIVILANSLLVIGMCVRFAIFVIWFAEYKDRNVGPSMGHVAYAMLTIVGAQIVNLVCWLIVRKRPAERRFLRHVVLGTLALALFCFWAGERFSYSGDPGAPGRYDRMPRSAPAVPTS
jgi:hypothetical protein